MGISASQAKFLAITSRKVDLEHRMQTICNRRIRLSNEMDQVADKYNRAVSDRHLYASQGDTYERLNVTNLNDMGYKVMDLETNEIVGDHHLPIVSLTAEDVTAATASEITATGATAAMQTLVNATDGLDFITHQTAVRNATTGIYELQEITSIGISSDAAMQTLMTDANGLSNNAALDLNYILMDDIDASGINWDSIGDGSNAFTGTFDGNCHTINGVTINATTSDQGMFANLDGVVKNLDLNQTSITINGGTSVIERVGSIAGQTGINGQILNCNSKNIDIDITTNTTSTYDVVNIGGITGYVDGTSTQGGLVDICSVDGTIDFSGIDKFDEIGGFIGANESKATINMSSADVDITVPTGTAIGGSYCINVFMGCDVNNGLEINNCYGAGDIKFSDGTAIPYTATTTNPGLGHNTNTNVKNSWGNNNGTIEYWNGQTTGSLWTGNTTMGTEFETELAPNEANVWLLPGNTNYTGNGAPQLNQEALATFFYDGYDPTEDELEAALRDGRYAIVRESDQHTQESINFVGTNYEVFDWRSTSIIADDLYEGNDYEAQTEYESEVNRINNKDKSLELEQQKVETEYNAITTERDTIQKLLKTNSEKSFKIFS